MELQYFDKFEYTYKQYAGYSIGKIVEELNKMGQEGWELINIVKDEIGRSRCIFKLRIICKQV